MLWHLTQEGWIVFFTLVSGIITIMTGDVKNKNYHKSKSREGPLYIAMCSMNEEAHRSNGFDVSVI